MPFPIEGEALRWRSLLPLKRLGPAPVGSPAQRESKMATR